MPKVEDYSGVEWSHVLHVQQGSVRIGIDDDYCIHARSLRENCDDDNKLRDWVNRLPLSMRNPPPTMGQLFDHVPYSEVMEFFIKLDTIKNFSEFTTEFAPFSEEGEEFLGFGVYLDREDYDFEEYRKSSRYTPEWKHSVFYDEKNGLFEPEFD